ncbi:MAG: hypothetical protein R2881_01195 [Eubacteriales bacterium]
MSFCVALPDGGDGRLLVSCKLTDGSAATTTGTMQTPSVPIETQAPVEDAQMPDESALPEQNP